MEKRKLLLIAISVGIFLIIAIGAALLIFSPKNTAITAEITGKTEGNGSVNSVYQPASPGSDNSDYTRSLPPTPDGNNGISGSGRNVTVDAVEMVRKPGDVPGLRDLPEGTAAQGSDYYVNGSGRYNSGQSAETVISVPKPSTAAVPDTPATGRAAPAAQRPAAVAATSSSSGSSSGSASKPNPAATNPKPAASTQNKAPVQTKVYDDFWVQTGAFSTIATAETVKESLATKGITSIIENRDVEGRTVYRVRVGPYTSKNEADYWLSLIKTIGGFEESQIRQTQSRR